MVIRFQLLSEEDLKKLSESAEHQNTKKGTNNWVKIYKQWVHERSINPILEEIDAESLDEVLLQFHAEIRKEDEREYEPNSLRVM